MRMLEANAPISKIVEYLAWVVGEHMGMKYDEGRRMRVRPLSFLLAADAVRCITVLRLGYPPGV
jgi:hypothetical protein